MSVVIPRNFQQEISKIYLKQIPRKFHGNASWNFCVIFLNFCIFSAKMSRRFGGNSMENPAVIFEKNTEIKKNPWNSNWSFRRISVELSSIYIFFSKIPPAVFAEFLVQILWNFFKFLYIFRGISIYFLQKIPVGNSKNLFKTNFTEILRKF